VLFCHRCADFRCCTCDLFLDASPYVGAPNDGQVQITDSERNILIARVRAYADVLRGGGVLVVAGQEQWRWWQLATGMTERAGVASTCLRPVTAMSLRYASKSRLQMMQSRLTSCGFCAVAEALAAFLVESEERFEQAKSAAPAGGAGGGGAMQDPATIPKWLYHRAGSQTGAAALVRAALRRCLDGCKCCALCAFGALSCTTASHIQRPSPVHSLIPQPFAHCSQWHE
jgi:hypothetical protein